MLLAIGCGNEANQVPAGMSDRPFVADPSDDAKTESKSDAKAGVDDGEEPPTTEVTPPAADAPKDPGLAATVEAIRRPDVRQIQQRLAKALTVTLHSGAPPTTPITWTAPSCPLRYQFQADATMSLADAIDRPASFRNQGIRVAGDFTMLRGDGDLALIRNGEIELSQVLDGIKNPGGKEKAESMAEIRLRRDGPQWIEVDGPTTLWSAYGSFPGFVEFWPALPSTTAPGSTAPWALTMHDRSSGMKVESTRGSVEVPEGYEFPTPKPETFDAQVEIQGWLEIEGQPAVVLVSQWSHDGSSTMGPEAGAAPSKPAFPTIDLEVSIQARSRYVVLANGRLLWADVHRINNVEMRPPKRESIKQRHELRATARLVEACDGPVIAGPPSPPSAEESALETFALLRNAAAEDDPDQIAEHLAPELLRAHGKEPLLRTLREHVARLGVGALGAPEIAMDVRRDGDRIRIHLLGNARMPDGSGMTVHTVAWTQTHDGKTTIVTLGTDTTEKDEGWSLLELSATAMKSGDLK